MYFQGHLRQKAFKETSKEAGRPAGRLCKGSGERRSWPGPGCDGESG